MNERLKDILSHLHSEVDQETLLRYLEGHLTPEKAHELEAQILDSDFDSDALEGLQALPDKKALPGIVEALNRDLRKKTAKRRSRQPRALYFPMWLLAALLLLLVLVIAGYWIIRLMNGH